MCSVLVVDLSLLLLWINSTTNMQIFQTWKLSGILVLYFSQMKKSGWVNIILIGLVSGYLVDSKQLTRNIK